MRSFSSASPPTQSSAGTATSRSSWSMTKTYVVPGPQGRGCAQAVSFQDWLPVELLALHLQEDEVFA